jgi:VWFA-related protein
VLFSDGVDTESKYGTGKQSMFDVEKAEAIIYPLQYDTQETIAAIVNDNQPQQGLSSSPTSEEFQLATRYLRGLAERSGGRLQQAESLTNVNEAFALIAEELRHQYSLGYYPTQEGRPGEFRRVRVEVMPPHKSVRARDGYRVGR